MDSLFWRDCRDLCACSVYLTFTFISRPDPDLSMVDEPATRLSPWIYLIALCITIVVPVYALGVYPLLPQQIGGGRALRVEVTTANQDLNSDFANPELETYLIDRASDNSLFLVTDKSRQHYRVVEVSSSLIQSIVYNQSP